MKESKKEENGLVDNSRKVNVFERRLKMKWRNIILVALFIFAFGCENPAYRRTSEKTAFREALNFNDIQKYENFVRTFPKSNRSGEVRQKIISFLECSEEWRTVEDLIKDFDDIVGAKINKDGTFLLLGKECEPQLPPLMLDDLLTIMKLAESKSTTAYQTVYQLSFRGGGLRELGVSIEPASGMFGGYRTGAPSTMSVRYIPSSTRDTHLGGVLFEIDRMLKSVSFGKDTLTHAPVKCSVPGHKTLQDRVDKSEEQKVGYFGRLWFKPKEIDLFRNNDKDIVWFKKYEMRLLAESHNPAPSEFAEHMTKNFDAYANNVMAFRELVRIGKMVAIVRWLSENNLIDSDFVNEYKFMQIRTPRSTPTVTGVISERRTYMGNYIQIEQYCLVGGVDLSPSNIYSSLPANFYVSGVKPFSLVEKIIAARPSPKVFKWRVTVGKNTYIAAMLPLNKKALSSMQARVKVVQDTEAQ